MHSARGLSANHRHGLESHSSRSCFSLLFAFFCLYQFSTLSIRAARRWIFFSHRSGLHPLRALALRRSAWHFDFPPTSLQQISQGSWINARANWVKDSHVCPPPPLPHLLHDDGVCTRPNLNKQSSPSSVIAVGVPAFIQCLGQFSI